MPRPCRPMPACRRGPLAKRCRTCDDLHPIGALTFGQCPDCAGLIALPLRGAGGRFVSFTHTHTSTHTGTGTGTGDQFGGAA